MLHRRAFLPLIAALLAACSAPGEPARAQTAQSRWFTTSDGVRLHYLESGPVDAGTIVFIPGWTMPAWIFDRQIEALDDRFHVIALDPRGQGQSEVAPFGYTPERRGRDIAELIATLPEGRVVLVGWSLGVLDSLSYLRAEGDGRIAGLVLVDNSIGENPPPRPTAGGGGSSAPPPTPEQRRAMRSAFVASMFAHDPGADYRARLTEDALRMTPEDERRLLAYPVPREDWRAAVHSTDRPVLYVVRPRWREQGENLIAARPNARMEVFQSAGHALFVDEPERFNALIADFAASALNSAP